MEKEREFLDEKGKLRLKRGLKTKKNKP